jgi:hypothetical protein
MAGRIRLYRHPHRAGKVVRDDSPPGKNKAGLSNDFAIKAFLAPANRISVGKLICGSQDSDHFPSLESQLHGQSAGISLSLQE